MNHNTAAAIADDVLLPLRWLLLVAFYGTIVIDKDVQGWMSKWTFL